MAFCPKCNSINTYQDGYDYACRMCGSRWPIHGPLPKGLLRKNDATPAGTALAKEEKTMAIRKPCRNCGRTLCIAQDGLCGGCFGSVKKYTKGTSEYDAALAAAKKRFTDPDYSGRTVKKKKSVNPKQKSTLDFTIKQVALTGISKIIEQMRIEREEHLSEAGKLAKAIEILSEKRIS